MQLSRATRPDSDVSDVQQMKEETRLRKLSNIVLIDYIKGMCELLYTQIKRKVLNEESQDEGMSESAGG